jgi:hypothetical protein
MANKKNKKKGKKKRRVVAKHAAGEARKKQAREKIKQQKAANIVKALENGEGTNKERLERCEKVLAKLIDFVVD